LAEVVEKARQDLFVTTIRNRRRYVADINSSNSIRRKFAERTAVNTLMQGSAADIIKKAMIDIVAARNRDMKIFQILLQIHDELIIEAREENTSEVCQLIQEKMSNSILLTVPLEVKVKVGHNWLDTKAFV
jgi:DNA polymerase-1